MARFLNDAASEYLEVQRTPITVAPFSISCWARTNDLAPAQCAVWVGDKDAAGDYWSLEVEAAGGGSNVEMRAHDGPGAGAQTSTSMTINTWHHLCGVEIASNSRAVWLNAGGKGTDVTEKTPDNADSIALGRRNDSSPINYWSGGIAEVAIWKDIALTDFEVWQLAQGKPPWLIYPENLIGPWLPFADRTDRDFSGRGYNMTAFNTPTWVADPLEITKIWRGDPQFVGRHLIAREQVNRTWARPFGFAPIGVRVPRNPAYIYQVPAVV